MDKMSKILKVINCDNCAYRDAEEFWLCNECEEYDNWEMGEDIHDEDTKSIYSVAKETGELPSEFKYILRQGN